MESYESLLNWAYELQKFGIKLGLSSTANLLARLGDPHEKLPAVHVGGTNGKGSVSAMISAILTEAGYRVGFYSSPHLVDFEERFRIGTENIGRAEAARLMERVKAAVDHREPPTFFEFTTAMAFLYFLEQKVDLSIMEVGLGGRLDATNLVRPWITVITNISLEHQEYLGDTVRKIAWEKAGIIKPGVPVLTAADQPEVLNEFREAAHRCGSLLYVLGRDFHAERQGDQILFEGFGRRISGISLPLKGPVQMRNAALAIAAVQLLDARGLHADDEVVRSGISRTLWPGRFQRVRTDPEVILDGAHNPAAMDALREAVREAFPHRTVIVVLGIMADKAVAEMIRNIAPVANELICTRPEYSRAADPAVLYDAACEAHPRVFCIPELSTALEHAAHRAVQTDGVVVVCGSLFTVGETLSLLRREDHPGLTADYSLVPHPTAVRAP